VYQSVCKYEYIGLVLELYAFAWGYFCVYCEQVVKEVWRKAVSRTCGAIVEDLMMSLHAVVSAAIVHCIPHSRDSQRFYVGQTTHKTDPTRVISIPNMVLWIQPSYSQPSKWHLHQFSRFCTAHPTHKHTDRQTTLHATSVVLYQFNKPHLMHCVHVMRCRQVNITPKYPYHKKLQHFVLWWFYVRLGLVDNILRVGQNWSMERCPISKMIFVDL